MFVDQKKIVVVWYSGLYTRTAALPRGLRLRRQHFAIFCLKWCLQGSAVHKLFKIFILYVCG